MLMIRRYRANVMYLPVDYGFLLWNVVAKQKSIKAEFLFLSLYLSVMC